MVYFEQANAFKGDRYPREGLDPCFQIMIDVNADERW
jgi:hypothetical protein